MTKRELLELVAEQAKEILDCYKHQEELHAELSREIASHERTRVELSGELSNVDTLRFQLTATNDSLRQIADALEANDRTVNGLLYAILDIKGNGVAARELSSAYAGNLKAIGEALGIADTSTDGMIEEIQRLKAPLTSANITTSSEDWRPIRKMPEGWDVREDRDMLRVTWPSSPGHSGGALYLPTGVAFPEAMAAYLDSEAP